MINMGSAHDIMQTFANKEIRAHFRDHDGWECRPVPSPGTRDATFFLSRDVRGRKETVALAVSFEEETSVAALAAVSAGHKGHNALKAQYLLVPKAADVSAVPKEIQVLSMDAFGFVEGKLVWLTKKKNAKRYPQRYPQPEEPAKAEAAVSACEPHAA
jgi:hypothetical protein